MDERRETIALFWYDLLNPLLREGLDRAEKRQLMDAITSQQHVIPYSSKRTVTAATVRRKGKTKVPVPNGLAFSFLVSINLDEIRLEKLLSVGKRS